MRYLVILVFALSAFSAGAQEINGVVRTADGSPIPGVTITIQGPEVTRSAITDSAGRYRMPVPTGTYSVQATLEGLSVQAKTVDAAPGRAQSVDFTFGVPVGTPVTGTIKGRVTDSGDDPLANVAVTISNESAEYNLKTNSDGYYTQSSLTPGPYLVKASKRDYKSHQKNVTLGDNQTLTVDFELERQ